MTTFRYVATTASGQESAGELEASNADEARRILSDRGLNVRELTAATQPELAPDVSRLTMDESQELAEHLAQLGTSTGPLAVGFRAAAAETSNYRVATALRRIAHDLDQGQTFDEVLASSDAWLPSHVAGLIRAAVRTGRLGDALSDLAEHQRTMMTLRRGVIEGFVYPLLVSGLSLLMLLMLLFGIGGMFERMFNEFELKLPLMTRLLFWWRDVGLWLLGASVLAALVGAWTYRLQSGEAAWSRFLATIPLFGPLRHWRSLAEWSRLMSVLLRHELPLPESLRLSADGVSNADVREMSLELAHGSEGGQSIAYLLSRARGFPSALVPLVDWGDRTGALAEAFDLGGELLTKRVLNRSTLLHGMIPPLLFISIGCCVLFLVGGLFFPLGMLVQGLS